MIPQSRTPPPKQATTVDHIEYSVNYLTNELQLDSFQSAAVKSHLTENQKEVEKVLELQISREEKEEKIKILHEKLTADISSLLNEEQKQKFDALQQKNKKKEKKSKKKS
ncbi:hypothetical protein GCM10011343_14240 [Flavobacterium orientale]|uniref:Uncharacterized protein n=2 Tax=Flavobacterium orientale TaxID=1756020 RepID=A0A917DC09_9FLAO|nr:hypothetical protein GCM10011343_14240 [Flavobacterium orientale]